MLTAAKRIITSGVQIFRRNLGLFTAAIAVMAMMIFIFAGLFTFRFLADRAVTEIQNRIAMSIYFDATVDESGILRARDLLTQLPEVAGVEYVSREAALEKFRTRHSSNSALVQAIEEIGSNPLQASLNIRAKDSRQYAAIATFIDKAPFRNQIAKVNYIENQLVIERLNRMIAGIRGGGLAVALALALIAALVTFNTMRIAIYSFREEISIMKLVGASHSFVRLPLMVSGILAGLAAGLASSAVVFVMLKASAPKIEALVPGIGVNAYLAKNAFVLLGIQLLLGVGLGMVSSIFAANKYLEE